MQKITYCSRGSLSFPELAVRGDWRSSWAGMIFAHIFVRMMRRSGQNPVVISGVVRHKSVELAAEVYCSRGL